MVCLGDVSEGMSGAFLDRVGKSKRCSGDTEEHRRICHPHTRIYTHFSFYFLTAIVQVV